MTRLSALTIGACALALLTSACGSTKAPSRRPDSGTVDDGGSDSGEVDAAALPECPTFDAGKLMGTIASSHIKEASGLVASRANPGVYWTHNDSDDTERIFAMASTGTDLGTYRISDDLNEDWEDMAMGPGPIVNASYLYIAAIGGNTPRHSLYFLRAPEPEVTLDQMPKTRDLKDVVRFRMHYPGDEAYDAETFMVDPRTGDAYVVTKDYVSGESKVFRYAATAQDSEKDVALVHVATVDFAPVGLILARAATGGDISGSGDAIVIRTYATAWLWPRAEGQTIADALKGPHCTVMLNTEKQGEAIAFTANGQDLVSTSEGTNQPLYRYDRVAAGD